ncbi:MAG: heme ABC transporter ATP-binding protein [Gammaproteobacteria bacterium]
MLEAREVHVKCNGRALLAGVSLAIAPGEVVALCGPNGAGKSTLLGVLAGLRPPSGGAVWLCGCPLRTYDVRALARVRAVLAQSSRFDFPLTALEVVLLGRLPHCRGREGERDHDIAARALSAVEAIDLALRRLPTLSGGERQRVQLARVLAQIWEPAPDAPERFLLLDEPNAGLDLAHEHRVLGLIRRLSREQGIGVLLVLHDLQLASRYADRVVVLKEGRVLTAGPPERALTRDALLSAYGVDVDILPGPLGVLLYPRTAAAPMGDRCV